MGKENGIAVALFVIYHISVVFVQIYYRHKSVVPKLMALQLSHCTE